MELQYFLNYETFLKCLGKRVIQYKYVNVLKKYKNEGKFDEEFEFYTQFYCVIILNLEFEHLNREKIYIFRNFLLVSELLNNSYDFISRFTKMYAIKTFEKAPIIRTDMNDLLNLTKHLFLKMREIRSNSEDTQKNRKNIYNKLLNAQVIKLITEKIYTNKSINYVYIKFNNKNISFYNIEYRDFNLDNEFFEDFIVFFEFCWNRTIKTNDPRVTTENLIFKFCKEKLAFLNEFFYYEYYKLQTFDIVCIVPIFIVLMYFIKEKRRLLKNVFYKRVIPETDFDQFKDKNFHCLNKYEILLKIQSDLENWQPDKKKFTIIFINPKGVDLGLDMILISPGIYKILFFNNCEEEKHIILEWFSD